MCWCVDVCIRDRQGELGACKSRLHIVDPVRVDQHSHALVLLFEIDGVCTERAMVHVEWMRVTGRDARARQGTPHAKSSPWGVLTREAILPIYVQRFEMHTRAGVSR